MKWTLKTLTSINGAVYTQEPGGDGEGEETERQGGREGERREIWRERGREGRDTLS